MNRPPFRPVPARIALLTSDKALNSLTAARNYLEFVRNRREDAPPTEVKALNEALAEIDRVARTLKAQRQRFVISTSSKRCAR